MIIEKLANVNKSKPQKEERVQQARCVYEGSQLLLLFGWCGTFGRWGLPGGSSVLRIRPRVLRLSPTFCLLAEY